jgi:hypothetical protein
MKSLEKSRLEEVIINTEREIEQYREASTLESIVSRDQLRNCLIAMYEAVSEELEEKPYEKS